MVALAGPGVGWLAAASAGGEAWASRSLIASVNRDRRRIAVESGESGEWVVARRPEPSLRVRGNGTGG